MAVTADRSGPYAPPSAVLEIITRYRSRGLGTPITADVLGRVGITESLRPRTLYALQALDLIDESGAPTPTLESLRLAPQGEYQKRLAEWLNGAYADVLTIIDPATATDTQVRDAFRSYNPLGQQDRMVTLFCGLYAAAGIRPEKSPAPRTTPTAKPRGRAVSTPAIKSSSFVAAGREKSHIQSNMPPALAGLMASIPQDGKGWTKATRDKFVALFGATLDFSIPIITQAEADKENSGSA
ncbi:MAG: DUF5343 domain-containing protein [Rhizomicrobium sp.]